MIRPRRAVLVALFAAYLVLLGWVILWKLQVPYVGAAALLPRPIKLVPFVASGDAGPSAPGEVVANIAFFLPYGVFLGLLARRRRWWQAGLLLVGSSLALEVLQHVLSVGTFDTSDILTNTAGGLAGFGLVALVRRRGPIRGVAVLSWAVSAATVLAVVGAGVFLALGLSYHQRHDVVPRTAATTAASGGARALAPPAPPVEGDCGPGDGPTPGLAASYTVLTTDATTPVTVTYSSFDRDGTISTRSESVTGPVVVRVSYPCTAVAARSVWMLRVTAPDGGVQVGCALAYGHAVVRTDSPADSTGGTADCSGNPGSG
jgi:glycopeptide antibiotics resistance protein